MGAVPAAGSNRGRRGEDEALVKTGISPLA